MGKQSTMIIMMTVMMLLGIAIPSTGCRTKSICWLIYHGFPSAGGSKLEKKGIVFPANESTGALGSVRGIFQCCFTFAQSS
uniref:Putative secreted protein n=1 Tax=Anopheles darlingi TaxID=43151 RepID=A0A2M4D9S9_ANODA